MGQQKATTISGDDLKSKDETAAKPKTGKKRKSKIRVPKGRVYVKSTYNNTIISVTDPNGNVVGWGSAGRTGFKGSKKSTPYAAQKTMEEVLYRLKDVGLSEVDVFVKGIGTGRESAVRALQHGGFKILSIKDQTPIPHGGVRPKKARRV
jgi:small subunit ribosomal protein S11